MRSDILRPFLLKHGDELPFVAAVKEVTSSLEPLLLDHPDMMRCFEALLEPDHVISFDVHWVDDQGVSHTNKGYRVQYCNWLGPYKGGLRFHPSVSLPLLKMLAFEQTFKNALTGLGLGGAKGGSDFDPKGKSDTEIQRFCEAFMDCLYPYIGIAKDVPAGDIGVGGPEISYLYHEYQKKTGLSDGALTGKSIVDGGSLLRPEATGYGLCYYASALLSDRFHTSFQNKRIVISGSGNVAFFAAEKAKEFGGVVVAMSDSAACIFDPEGIDLAAVKAIKQHHSDRIRVYLNAHPGAQLFTPKEIWSLPCDLALPCATQFEIDDHDASLLVNHHVLAVCEGSNMSATPEAAALLRSSDTAYAPGKASNAGGVTVSGFEMIQNIRQEHWNALEVDSRLKNTMESIYSDTIKLADELSPKNDLVTLTNRLSFSRLFSAFQKR
jgi:glutamate dehydrogenase (NADP+)